MRIDGGAREAIQSLRVRMQRGGADLDVLQRELARHEASWTYGGRLERQRRTGGVGA
uniref:Predicted protein n=1 Tax=Hordeum vulgare subsp. vulgare TaxID=112509 RepID=F2EB59_HORVV|nr:predicted protein [Hordeum vulgare subsp. vulgare]